MRVESVDYDAPYGIFFITFKCLSLTSEDFKNVFSKFASTFQSFTWTISKAIIIFLIYKFLLLALKSRTQFLSFLNLSKA